MHLQNKNPDQRKYITATYYCLRERGKTHSSGLKAM